MAEREGFDWTLSTSAELKAKSNHIKNMLALDFHRDPPTSMDIHCHWLLQPVFMGEENKKNDAVERFFPRVLLVGPF